MVEHCRGFGDRAILRSCQDCDTPGGTTILSEHQAGSSSGGDNPMFSVVMPTHNRAHLLPRAIQSVLGQTLANWELIVVDDGSTDNTRQVVKRFDDPRIRYLYQENAGAAKARNLGAKESRADCIVFLDSDDEALPEWLRYFSQAFELSRVGIVFGAAIRIDEQNGSVEGKVILPRDGGAVFHHQTVLFMAGAFAVRRDLFEAVGGYHDVPSRQHKELGIRIIPYCLQHGWKVHSSQVPVLKWFRHTGDRIGTDVVAQRAGAESLLRDHGDMLLRNSPKIFATYCYVAGINAVKMNDCREARSYLWKALKYNPLQWKYYAGVLLSLLPSSLGGLILRVSSDT